MKVSVGVAMRNTVHSVQMLWQSRPRRFKPYESMEKDIGTVDATIDQLLAMSTDVENEKLRSQMEMNDDTSSLTSHLSTTHTQLLPQFSSLPPNVPSGSSSSSSPINRPHSSSSLKSPSKVQALRDLRNWNPPLIGPLPNSFLRLDSGFEMTDGGQSSCTRHTPLNEQELAQFLEDERMALFLQNEEFMKELRRNKDFMSSLDQKPGESGEHIQDDAVFREKLKSMGKVSKRKFAQIARLFQRSTPSSASGSKGSKFRHINAIPSRDSLLLADDAQSDTEESDLPPKHKDGL